MRIADILLLVLVIIGFIVLLNSSSENRKTKSSSLIFYVITAYLVIHSAIAIFISNVGNSLPALGVNILITILMTAIFITLPSVALQILRNTQHYEMVSAEILYRRAVQKDREILITGILISILLVILIILL